MEDKIRRPPNPYVEVVRQTCSTCFVMALVGCSLLASTIALTQNTPVIPPDFSQRMAHNMQQLGLLAQQIGHLFTSTPTP